METEVDPQPNMRRISGNAAEEGEKGLSGPDGLRTPQEHS